MKNAGLKSKSSNPARNAAASMTHLNALENLNVAGSH